MAVRVRGTDLTITVTINNKPTVSLKPSRIYSFMFAPVAGKGSFLTAVPSPPLLRATISSVPLAASTRAGKNFKRPLRGARNVQLQSAFLLSCS